MCMSLWLLVMSVWKYVLYVICDKFISWALLSKFEINVIFKIVNVVWCYVWNCAYGNDD